MFNDKQHIEEYINDWVAINLGDDFEFRTYLK